MSIWIVIVELHILTGAAMSVLLNVLTERVRFYAKFIGLKSMLIYNQLFPTRMSVAIGYQLARGCRVNMAIILCTQMMIGYLNVTLGHIVIG